MIAIPIGSYFLTVNTVFRGQLASSHLVFPHLNGAQKDGRLTLRFLGNSSFAGGLAAVLANVVLISYIIVAMNEDTSEDDSKKSESKKAK